jgi:sulfur carrier protein ThiS
MPVKLILRKKEYEVPAGLTLQQAIRAIGLHPETYLALRQGAMIAQTDVLHEGDTVKLIAVISGGNTAPA